MGSVKSGEINYLAPVGYLFVVKFFFFYFLSIGCNKIPGNI